MNRRLFALIALVLLLVTATPTASADDWPQYRGPHRDGVWRETDIVQRLPDRLTFRWKTPLGGGFSGPAVVDGRVFVTDRRVAPGEVRGENRWNVTTPVDGSERVLCLDAATGEILWTHEYACRYEISYPTGPRATPSVHEGRVYTVGAMGDLRCLDVSDGALLWAKNYVTDFGTKMNPWGMAAAPLVEGDLLIALVGGADRACVVAFDKHTGKEVWRNLDCSDPGYSSPIVISEGGVRQLIVWNSLGLYGLDVQSGGLLWDVPFVTKMAHAIASPVFDPDSHRLFITSFFDGPVMLQMDPDRPEVDILWHGTSHSEKNPDKLHGLMSTPALDGDLLLGVCGYGQLRCLDAATGRQYWETLELTGENRWSNAFLVRHEDRYFLLNEHGELILARLTLDGYQTLGRASLIEPTLEANRRMVVWSHPAFAGRAVFARNDKEIVSVDLAEGGPNQAETPQ